MRTKELVRGFLSRRNASHRILSGPIRGARIHTSWHDYPGAILGTTEKPLLAWFDQHVRTGETWLDIGAHYGYTAIAIARATGSGGRVFAFEPVLTSAACITRTRALNNLPQITVVPMGLDEHPSLRTIDLPTVRGMADSTIAPELNRERIFTTSLDALWPSLSGGNPEIHGVKIDVQGMELRVLLGMNQLLRGWHPKLALEFHRGVDRSEILNLLRACGYHTQCSPIDPGSPRDRFADDTSYSFEPLATCESLSTPSSIARS